MKAKVFPSTRFQSFKENLNDYFTIFSNNTGIHGLKYMGEQDRPILEKICWIVAFCVSLYLGMYLIMQQWFKWETSPVLVSFAQSPTPIWEIPFPAITVCPETKSKQRNFNFTHYYYRVQKHMRGEDNLTAEELKNFTNAALVCDPGASQNIQGDDYDTTDSSVNDFLIKVAPKIYDTFFTCLMSDVNLTCDPLFRTTITDEGICFTFNMLSNKDIFTEKTYIPDEINVETQRPAGWSLEKGYPKVAGFDIYPYRVIAAGKLAGLTLLLASYKQDIDYICRGPLLGYKILLHNPDESPKIGKQFMRISLNTVVTANIKPNMMTTSEGLKKYSPHQRQCFFSGERTLFFFKIYSQQHCQLECLTNYTLTKCGCVAFYMPHENETRICGMGRKDCLVEAENEYLAQETKLRISTLNSYRKQEQDIIKNCDCLPACSSINYNVESTSIEFNWQQLFAAFKENISEFEGIQFSRVELYFKQQQFITSQRNELYGLNDFLANCGGLLGLFTGFSFLSMFEIIYFLSLRLVCNIKKHGTRFWSGSEELLEKSVQIETEFKEKF